MNIYQCFLPLGGAVNSIICYLNFIAQLIWPANCYKTTPIHMPTHRMLFIFYHMITNMTYLSYLIIYTYHWYRLSTFRWNPLRSPSPLTMTHSLLSLLIPPSFWLMPNLPYHMLYLSYAHHWLIRYFSHSSTFRLDDSLSSYLMDTYLSSLVTCYLLCI